MNPGKIVPRTHPLSTRSRILLPSRRGWRVSLHIAGFRRDLGGLTTGGKAKHTEKQKTHDIPSTEAAAYRCDGEETFEAQHKLARWPSVLHQESLSWPGNRASRKQILGKQVSRGITPQGEGRKRVNSLIQPCSQEQHSSVLRKTHMTQENCV